MNQAFQLDIDAIAGIAAVPTILDVVCQTTGMGFAAVARVTEERWIACGVRDDIGFGLKPGGELEIKTTICHEIHETGEMVVINHASCDPVYSTHHTPALYGIESYISMPIVLYDGTFFGTLCAIDPKPAQVDNPKVIGMFKLFAELIAFHLDAHYRITSSEAQLSDSTTQLQATNKELEAFSYSVSHHLRGPLRSIDGYSQMLQQDYTQALNETGRGYVSQIRMESQRMGRLIDAMWDLSRLTRIDIINKPLNLSLMVKDILYALHRQAPERQVTFEIQDAVRIDGDEHLIRTVLNNLLSNAWKFTSHHARARIAFGTALDEAGKPCFFVRDDGAGFKNSQAHKLFQAFHRLHGVDQFPGSGIGLAAVERIVTRLGGRVWAEGEIEKGATFYFTLK